MIGAGQEGLWVSRMRRVPCQTWETWDRRQATHVGRKASQSRTRQAHRRPCPLAPTAERPESPTPVCPTPAGAEGWGCWERSRGLGVLRSSGDAKEGAGSSYPLLRCCQRGGRRESVGTQRGAEAELCAWPAHSTGNRPGEASPQPSTHPNQSSQTTDPGPPLLERPVLERSPCSLTTAKA